MENNNHPTSSRRRSFFYVWTIAFVGSLSFIPTIIKFIPTNKHLPFSITTLIILSILQSVVLTAIFAAVGALLAPRIGFRAVLVNVPIKEKIFWNILARQFYYGATIGLGGAIVAYLFAPEFIGYLSLYPFVSRLFGGLFEEVAIRWCLMTMIVWILWRIFQHGIGIPKELLVLLSILLNQILFALGHTPALMKLGIINPIWSVITIFIVSLPWCWLYWKQGIESAFIAHTSFHVFVALFVALKV